MEQKKKSSNYIIPATFFTALSPAKPKAVVTKQVPVKIETPVPVQKITETKTEVASAVTKKPLLKNIKRRTSALSLKNVHQKKEIKKATDVEENYDNHPKTPFTQEELKEAWKKYYFKLQNLGEKNIASIVLAGAPKLSQNFSIVLTLPNTLMKSQLEKGKHSLLGFLREKLNNYGISMTIDVNETVAKKFAYTPQEKYEKLKEKNPLMEKLKNTFGLDL